MSPDAAPAVAALARLQAEIATDAAAMERRARELEALVDRWTQVEADRGQVALAAISIHGWYTALETLLERVARLLDHSVPSGSRSHAELLSQLMTELPGIRPAILPRRLEPELLALLGFRHFFRHAYGAELDPERLVREARRLLKIEPEVKGSISSCSAFLKATLEQLSKS